MHAKFRLKNLKEMDCLQDVCREGNSINTDLKEVRCLDVD
jgi:hypothetical protein